MLPLNCEQLRIEDLIGIFEKILKEFPITDVEIYIPKWVEMLSEDAVIKKDLLENMKVLMKRLERMQDITQETMEMGSPYVSKTKIDSLDLSNGKVRILLEVDEKYYYDMLSEMIGEEIEGEYELMSIIRELSEMKKEYVKVKSAIAAVRQKGYGVVMPVKEEITLEEPVLVKQGNRYGVKIKAAAPSIHMIRANIETEISPLVGNESQATDLIKYISQNHRENGDIWGTNIFGKSIEELVEDGMKTKIYQVGEESQTKLQDTMRKIVNDSNGGMVCIII